MGGPPVRQGKGGLLHEAASNKRYFTKSQVNQNFVNIGEAADVAHDIDCTGCIERSQLTPDEVWNEVTNFAGGPAGPRFANAGEGYEPAGYMKDLLGQVHVKGTVEVIADPTQAGTLIFQLPPPYWPEDGNRVFLVPKNSGVGMSTVLINDFGQLTLYPNTGQVGDMSRSTASRSARKSSFLGGGLLASAFLGARSSVGRALPWHGRGQEFDSPRVHHTTSSSQRRIGLQVTLSGESSRSTVPSRRRQWIYSQPFPTVETSHVAPYIRSCLERGAHVAKGFLENAALEEGAAASTLPADFPNQALENPLSGETGGAYYPSELASVSALADLVSSYLTENPEHVYITEDHLGHPWDNNTGIGVHWVHDGNLIYLVARPADSSEEVNRVVEIARTPFLTLGFFSSLTSLDVLPSAGGACDATLLHRLGRDSVGCAVGAYDQTGYVLWQERGDY